MTTTSNTQDSNEDISLTTANEHHQHTLQLIESAKDSICIHCHDLTPRIYNHPDIAAALTTFITTNSAHRKIRISVNDVQAIVNCDHKILDSFHRLTSSISIQKIAKQHTNQLESFIIIDKKVLLLRKDYTIFKGDILHGAKRIKETLDLFEEIWSHTQSDSNLNRLYI